MQWPILRQGPVDANVENNSVHDTDHAEFLVRAPRHQPKKPQP